MKFSHIARSLLLFLLPLLVQFDAGRLAWWMLSDGGGDVVAMCK